MNNKNGHLLERHPPSMRALFLVGLAVRLVGMVFNGMSDFNDMLLDWGFAVHRDGLSAAFGVNYGILSYAMFGLAATFAPSIPRFWWAPYKIINLAFDIAVLLALLRISPPERRKLTLVLYWLNPWFVIHQAYHGFWEAPHILFGLLAVLAVKRETRTAWILAGALLMVSAMFKPQGLIYFIAPLGVYSAVQLVRGVRTAFLYWLAGAVAVATVTSLLIWTGGGSALALINNYRSAFTVTVGVSNGGPGIWRFVSFMYMRLTGQTGHVAYLHMPSRLRLMLSGVGGLACVAILVAFALKVSLARTAETSTFDRLARRLKVSGQTVTRSADELLLLVLALGSLILSQLAPRAHINHSYTMMVLLVPLAITSRKILRQWTIMNVMLGLSHVLVFALGNAALLPPQKILARYTAASGLVQRVVALPAYRSPDSLLLFQQSLTNIVTALPGETLVSLASPVVFFLACLLVRSVFTAADQSVILVDTSTPHVMVEA
jgi:hypothetical protein